MVSVQSRLEGGIPVIDTGVLVELRVCCQGLAEEGGEEDDGARILHFGGRCESGDGVELMRIAWYEV